MKVIPGMCFGHLTTKWSWKNHSCGQVWKCTCDCGGYCYAKEEALILGIVKDCGGIVHQAGVEKYYLGNEESYAYARGENVTPEEAIKVLKRVKKYRKRT